MYEVDEWTIEQDKDEKDLWLVYPTEEGRRSFNSRYFFSESDAIDFAENYSPEYDDIVDISGEDLREWCNSAAGIDNN